jgi:hypothetical protein
MKAHLSALAIASFTLMASDPSSAFAQAAASQSESQSQPLTVNSTIGALLANPLTRPVLDRHLPNLATNAHLIEIRNWPLRELATNPHARGMSPEMLTQIQTELAAAQAPGHASPAQ